MKNNIDKYTLELKSKLDKNYLSPLFIRFANLLYANEFFEECITVCKTGLLLYPNYLTAKLILLKAYMKAEYLNESEILFDEIKSKITNIELRVKLESNIQNLKAISKQEKIYYPKSVKNKFDFKSFSGSFQLQENLFSEYMLKDFFANDQEDKINENKEFQNYLYQYDNFHFKKTLKKDVNSKENSEKNNLQTRSENEIFSKIKIVTETLADIYAKQGNYKEAFEAYNFLLRAGSGNSKRIEDKLNELERNMIKHD